MDKKSTLILQMIMLYCFWGFNWVFMRIANDYLSPMFFVVFRFMLGAAVLLIVCAVRKKLLPPRQYLPWFILTGILMIAIGNVMVQTSITFIGAGMTAVVNYTQSAFVCILAVFFLGERFTLRKLLGIIFCVAGLLILMNISETGSVEGIFLSLGAAVLWASCSVIVKLKLTGCDMLQCTAWQMACGSVVLIIYMFTAAPEVLHEGLSSLSQNASDPLLIVTLLYNGLLASALAFVLWNSILTKMEAGKASIAIMGIPAVGVLTCVLILGEPMSLSIAFGMILVFIGIFTVLSTGKKTSPE